MDACAKEGTCLTALIQKAKVLCQEAERQCPRKGRGRRPEIADWAMAVLIVVAILKQRKSKSSQYRYLHAHRERLLKALQVNRFPSRSTYFDRYRRAWNILEVAIRLTGQRAVVNAFACARCVAVDKSVVKAQGPLWNKRHQACGCLPSGADLDATWTYSAHHGWTLGYSYEVVVTAEKTGPVWPLLASAGPASWQPNRTFPGKIPNLPTDTRYVLADSGYDSNALGEMLEYSTTGSRTGKRLLCPQYLRGKRRRIPERYKETKHRKRHRLLREDRQAFFQKPFAQRLIKRRGARIEPFNDWLKSRFDLHHRAWHRGLDNNRTQLLAAIFAYQLLLWLNHDCGHANGRIQWILDRL